MIGSTLVTSTPTARRVTTTSTRWKCAASLFLTNLPHCQPKYCEIDSAADRPVSPAAPQVAETKPITAIASPIFPTALATGPPTWQRLATQPPQAPRAPPATHA